MATASTGGLCKATGEMFLSVIFHPRGLLIYKVWWAWIPTPTYRHQHQHQYQEFKTKQRPTKTEAEGSEKGKPLGHRLDTDAVFRAATLVVHGENKETSKRKHQDRKDWSASVSASGYCMEIRTYFGDRTERGNGRGPGLARPCCPPATARINIGDRHRGNED